MQEKQANIGVVWFRKDLRINDNIVLEEASKNHSQLIGVYCFNPKDFKINSYGFKKTEKFRAKFLIETITNLKQNLKRFNIELFVYHDTPAAVIPKLIQQLDIKNVYLQKEWTSEEQKELQSIKQHTDKNIVFKSYYNQFLYHPDDINIPIHQIPQVFTSFRKKLEKYCNVRNVSKASTLNRNSTIKNTTQIPTLSTLGFQEFKTHPNTAFPFTGGETSALNRLHDYIFDSKHIGRYKTTRNGLVGLDYSSKFSSWLANGSISARTIFWKIKQFEKEHYKNQSTYWLIFELIWRDFFKYIALRHCSSIFKIHGILEKDYNWKTNETIIKTWTHGTTRSNFVNANMVELNKTGWMSNRGRQNVASYFAKTLNLDWRIGAAYFESLLIDYDVHSNYGNWMYVSGVGNDPRDRKFNVDAQANRYDTDGTFQKLWLQNKSK